MQRLLLRAMMYTFLALFFKLYRAHLPQAQIAQQVDDIVQYEHSSQKIEFSDTSDDDERKSQARETPQHAQKHDESCERDGSDSQDDESDEVR